MYIQIINSKTPKHKETTLGFEEIRQQVINMQTFLYTPHNQTLAIAQFCKIETQGTTYMFLPSTYSPTIHFLRTEFQLSPEEQNTINEHLNKLLTKIAPTILTSYDGHKRFIRIFYEIHYHQRPNILDHIKYLNKAPTTLKLNIR
jgi:hypothetical protein